MPSTVVYSFLRIVVILWSWNQSPAKLASQGQLLDLYFIVLCFARFMDQTNVNHFVFEFEVAHPEKDGLLRPEDIHLVPDPLTTDYIPNDNDDSYDDLI